MILSLSQISKSALSLFPIFLVSQHLDLVGLLVSICFHSRRIMNQIRWLDITDGLELDLQGRRSLRKSPCSMQLATRNACWRRWMEIRGWSVESHGEMPGPARPEAPRLSPLRLIARGFFSFLLLNYRHNPKEVLMCCLAVLDLRRSQHGDIQLRARIAWV